MRKGLAAALILLTAGCGTEIRNTADDCIMFVERAYGDTRPENREMAYLCKAREIRYGSAPPDAYVLKAGRAACRDRDFGADDAVSLVFLCPEAAVAVGGERLVWKAARHREEEALRRYSVAGSCEDPWPQVRSRTSVTAAAFVDGEGYRLVDAAGMEPDHGVAAVPVETRKGAVCVTVKTFRAKPSGRPKGWRDVVERGFRADAGVVNLADSDLEPIEVGVGSWNLRVWKRGAPPREEHLILFYPEPPR
ncbi:hypothetical protein [Herbidospora daliensis]|uniref:hypothetical protein n=1 Tax=Herbidospora daliensis TaxID=295585 RepID=UPI00078469F0|nr:hypothetical protein [Herbidospora daliensis]